MTAPEQQRHGLFELSDIVDKRANGVSIKIGKAYRRQPLFETLAKTKGSGIDADGLRALRYYRARHVNRARSLTRCALDGLGPVVVALRRFRAASTVTHRLMPWRRV